MKIIIEGAKVTGHQLESDDSIYTELTHITPKSEDSRFQYLLFKVPGYLAGLGEMVNITFETVEEKANAHAK